MRSALTCFGFVASGLLTGLTIGSAAAQTPTKTVGECRHEYRAYHRAIVDAHMRRPDFIAVCLTTPVGSQTPIATTPASYWTRASEDWKHGFQFTPAYLSSPQVAVPAYVQAGVLPPSVLQPPAFAPYIDANR